ncbi:MAG: hypothetical protein FWD97_01925 [Defluviitaleaceae bacterium]|nr:hypothetical protein [Defluviitaleaceae bacterium]
MLIDALKLGYAAKIITTTYTHGNEVAKGLYQSLGFVQTDVICEDGVYEVNMALSLG